MFYVNTKKQVGIQVKSQLHRQIARHIFKVTARAEGVKEARRQAAKYIQFGLYDSEKTYTDLAAPVQQKMDHVSDLVAARAAA